MRVVIAVIVSVNAFLSKSIVGWFPSSCLGTHFLQAPACAEGEEQPRLKIGDSEKIIIGKDGTEVHLRKRKGSNAWTLTVFDVWEDEGGALDAACDAFQPTHGAATPCCGLVVAPSLAAGADSRLHTLTHSMSGRRAGADDTYIIDHIGEKPGNTADEPLYTQFRHDAQAAIAFLKKEKRGIAVAALYHPLVGDIDLAWGKTSDNPRAKGFGLAKIVQWHPEVLTDLQGFLLKMDKIQVDKSRRQINLFESKGTARGGIRLEWNGQTRHWLITAYDKNAGASKDTSAAFDHVAEPIPAISASADTYSIDQINEICGGGTTTDIAAIDAKDDTARPGPATNPSLDTIKLNVNAGASSLDTANDLLTNIENAAHAGDFGQNPRRLPMAAGNYKKGRVDFHGLPLAIEQPRGTYRTGTDKSGQRWSSFLAANYGYVAGTKGADGDPVDCFVGVFPDADHAYVVNQYVNGQFDEHKIMLGFPDEQCARNAYLDSFERGWDGLKSIIPATLTQLQWWLKNGDLSRPLQTDYLPYAGLKMSQKIWWTQDANPETFTFDQILYQIRSSEGGELVLDRVTLDAIYEDSDGVMAFDALVTPYMQLERKMNVLQGLMNRASPSVQIVAQQISQPFMQRGTANVAVVWELSDGQTISVFLHNPDVTPKKIAPTDELISWKWLLNKKDITLVVAPEHGEDLNPREVAKRIMRLADKNGAAFARANAKRADTMQTIDGLKTEIASLEGELATKQNRLEAAKVEAESKPVVDPKKAFYAGLVAALQTKGWEYVQPNEQVSKGDFFTWDSGFIDSVKLNKWVKSGFVDFKEFDATEKTPEQMAAELDDAVNQAQAEAAAADGGESEKSLDQYIQEAGGDLIAATREYFKENLQGKIVNTSIGDVRITGKSFNKMRSGMRNDPLKAKLVPMAVSILTTGVVSGPSPLSKPRSDGITEFYFFEKDVDVEDKIVTAGATVGRDNHGNLLYNISHDESQAWAKRKGQPDDPSKIDRGQAGLMDDVTADPTNSIDQNSGDGFNLVILKVIDKQTGERLYDLEDDVGQEGHEPKPVTLTGKELGDFPDTEEGTKELRKAAKAFLMGMRDEWVFCKGLGKEVQIRKRGIKETIAFSADIRKLKALAAIKQIISGADSPIREDNFKKNEKPDVVAYYHLRNSINLDGATLPLTVVVQEDDKGFMHYDMLIDRNVVETKTALDSSSAASVRASTPNHNSGNAHTLSIALDSIGGEVVNLFFDGEEPEVVPDEEPADDGLAERTVQGHRFGNVTQEVGDLLDLNKKAFRTVSGIDDYLNKYGLVTAWSASNEAVSMDDASSDAFKLDGPRIIRGDISKSNEVVGHVLVRGDGESRWYMADDSDLKPDVNYGEEPEEAYKWTGAFIDAAAEFISQLDVYELDGDKDPAKIKADILGMLKRGESLPSLYVDTTEFDALEEFGYAWTHSTPEIREQWIKAIGGRLVTKKGELSIYGKKALATRWERFSDEDKWAVAGIILNKGNKADRKQLAGGAAVTTDAIPPDATAAALATLAPYIGQAQLTAITQGVIGDEQEFYQAKVAQLAQLINTMPEMPWLEGKGETSLAYLHYFDDNGDWYITERDRQATQTQAFGLANPDGTIGAMGNIDISQLTGEGAELDLDWEPVMVETVNGFPVGQESTPIQLDGVPKIPPCPPFAKGGVLDGINTVQGPSGNPECAADQALFNAILAGDLTGTLDQGVAERLEAAWYRSAGDDAMMALGTQAMAAYAAANGQAGRSLKAGQVVDDSSTIVPDRLVIAKGIEDEDGIAKPDSQTDPDIKGDGTDSKGVKQGDNAKFDAAHPNPADAAGQGGKLDPDKSPEQFFGKLELQKPHSQAGASLPLS